MRKSAVAWLLTLLLVAAACGDPERPGAIEWSAHWDAMVAVVPSQAELGTPPDIDLCSHALGELRTLSPDVTPTPDLAIDSVVHEWVRIAEEMMFECPPESDKIPDLESGYEELRRLEAEVSLVLEFEQDE